MKINLTRKTIVGYGVNTSPSQGAGGFYFEKPASPQWEGTINTISRKMSADRFLGSLTNTYYSAAWFVKIDSSWLRAVDRQAFAWAMDELLTQTTVEVEVEDPVKGSTEFMIEPR